MKVNRMISVLMIAVLVFSLSAIMTVPVLAAEDAPAAGAVVEQSNENDLLSAKAIAAAIAIGAVGFAGAVGMAIAISKCAESMARQPEAASKINSAMMLGLVFIETVIIYALIVAILIIFVL